MRWRCVERARSARKFLLHVIVAASVFAAAPLAAQAQDPVKDLNDHVKKLIEALKPKPATTTTPAETPRLDPDPEALAQVATTISKILEPKLAATTWANDLASLLASNKANIANEDLRAALVGLRNVLPAESGSARPSTDPPAAGLRKQVLDLVLELEKFRQTLGVPPKELDQPAMAQLATALSTFIDPTLAATVWAGDLAFVLAERKPDLQDAGVKAALKKLPDAMRTVVDTKLGPYLNIVQAWYGDFYYIRRAASGQLRINADTGTGFRVCDATHEVREACQGKKTCPVKPENGNGKPDLTNLCGQDPVPLASEDIKGIAIEFQCLHATRETWDRLQNNWRIEDSGAYPSKMVMLRASTDVTVRCVAELPQEPTKP